MFISDTKLASADKRYNKVCEECAGKQKPGALKVEYAKNLNTKSFELSVGETAAKKVPFHRMKLIKNLTQTNWSNIHFYRYRSNSFATHTVLCDTYFYNSTNRKTTAPHFSFAHSLYIYNLPGIAYLWFNMSYTSTKKKLKERAGGEP